MTRSRSPRPPALRYRAARRTDVDTLAELAYRAYRMRSAEAYREFFTEHPRFTLRDVRVGELDGEIVSSLVLYPLHAFVRGQSLGVTGIGSVAVSPEHRRRGIAEAFLRATLREMRQRGDALSVLYPFRNDFYRKFGWGLIERPNLLSFPPALLPPSDEVRRVRRLRLPDRPVVQELYDREMQAHGHWALARRPEWWEKRLWGYEGDWVVHEGRRRGQIEGYLQYQIDAGDGPWKLIVTVNEFLASTPAAYAGLWGYLHAMRDQASEIVIATPGDGLWPTVLGDAANLRGELKLGVLRTGGHSGHGAMLRLVDVKGALERVPVAPAARGEVTLEVTDAILPLNARAWRVHAREGRLHVRPEPARASGARGPKIVAPVEVLAAIVAGSLTPDRAAEAGLIDDVRGGVEVIEPWFRARPAFLHTMNAF